MNRQLDAALDRILGQALRCRGQFIEIHDKLEGGANSPERVGAAMAMATLAELDVDQLVRLCHDLHRANRSVESFEAAKDRSL